MSIRSIINMRVHKRNRARQKSIVANPTTEEQAQLNLIEISNFDFEQEQTRKFENTPQIQQQKITPHVKIRTRVTSIPKINQVSRSTEFNKSVSEKMTESFKASRRSSSSELHTDQVCVIKRKLPLSLSSYMIIGMNKPESDKQEPSSPTYKPRPCISMRTYFKKRLEIDKEEMNWTARTRYETRKLFPFQETYWKISKGSSCI